MLPNLGFLVPLPNAQRNNTKVICVFTSDFDSHRVRESLNTLGFTQKLSYKTNASTRDNQYLVNGSTNISKYYY